MLENFPLAITLARSHKFLHVLFLFSFSSKYFLINRLIKLSLLNCILIFLGCFFHQELREVLENFPILLQVSGLFLLQLCIVLAHFRHSGNQHHNQVTELFHQHKGTSVLSFIITYISYPVQSLSLATINMFFTSIIFPCQEYCINGIIKQVTDKD